MAFSDKQEVIIEKVLSILGNDPGAIKDEFTRFDVIYVSKGDRPGVSLEIQPTFPAMAKILDFNLDRFFHDVYYNFEKTFEYRIWHYENIPDDMPFIGIYEMGYAIHCLEMSMLGAFPRWIAGAYPAYGRPIMKNRDDLAILEQPDFFTSGFMPKVISEYRSLKEDLEGRLEIGIRKFVQGPLQLASNLLGKDKTYQVLRDDPGLIKQLMDFQYDFHLNWISGWEGLHGRAYGMVNICEETLNTEKSITPEIFQEVIMPYHILYGNTFNQIHWHSCANINSILPFIAEIPNIRMMEIGPYTDTLKAVESFAGINVDFYKIPNVETELLNPATGVQEALFESVLRASENSSIKILVETPELEPALKLLDSFRRFAD